MNQLYPGIRYNTQRLRGFALVPGFCRENDKRRGITPIIQRESFFPGKSLFVGARCIRRCFIRDLPGEGFRGEKKLNAISQNSFELKSNKDPKNKKSWSGIQDFLFLVPQPATKITQKSPTFKPVFSQRILRNFLALRQGTVPNEWQP
jgi:hypothetical protein